MFCPNTKNNFTNVIIVGALVGLCPRGLHTDIKSMKKSRSPWKTIHNGQNIYKIWAFFDLKIVHFEGFFYKIVMFLSSLYQYVDHRYIKIPMHCWFCKFGMLFFFICEKHIIGPYEGFLRSLRHFWPLKMVPRVIICFPA